MQLVRIWIAHSFDRGIIQISKSIRSSFIPIIETFLVPAIGNRYKQKAQHCAGSKSALGPPLHEVVLATRKVMNAIQSLAPPDKLK